MWVNARENGGYQIVDVAADGAAQKAGIQVGDVIDAMDGKPVIEAGLSDFRLRMRTDPVGTQVHLKLSRAAEHPEVTLTLADQI
jgi:C-terminal processing protease CtpA/Prc